MNARFSPIVSRLATLLAQAIQHSRSPEDKLLFDPRHAEHLAAAGFGFLNLHAYLEAAKAKSELCTGYYVPDVRTIVSRMTGLGYSDALAAECAHLFVQAVSNGNGSTCADLAEDLQGERLRVNGSNRLAYNALMEENLKDDLLRDESVLWPVLAQHGILHDGETEDNLEVSVDLPPDFPALRHLGNTLDVPVTAAYDLDQGEDQEALFYGNNRQLAFRGTLRLRPSGLRGWAYPTLRIDPAPFLDHRTEAEMQGDYQTYDWPTIDKDEFEDGYAAGRAGIDPVPHASFDWLAGWVMVANDANATGHMSTGQVDRALAEALANALTLDDFRPVDALQLAAQACRSCASTRTRRTLEELIQEQTDQLD